MTRTPVPGGPSLTTLLAGGLMLVLLLWPAVGSGQGIELRRQVPPPEPRDCPAEYLEHSVPAVGDADAREAARLTTAATHAAILGDHDQARQLLARAAELDPSAENVAFLLARTLEELGEVERAVSEYCRFAGLAGDSPDAREAREHVRRIAPPTRPGIPDQAVARFEAALEAYAAGAHSAAELDLSRVVAAAPGWASPYYNRAIIRAALNQRDPALADFERFLELEPEAPERELVTRWIRELQEVGAVHYSPGTAFAVGLLPGAGHFYTERPLVGTLLVAVAGGALVAGVAHEVTHVQCLGIPQNGTCPPDQILSQHVERPLLGPGVAVAAAASLLGAIDAARGARRHNAREPEIRLSGRDTVVRLRPPAMVQRGANLDIALLRLEL